MGGGTSGLGHWCWIQSEHTQGKKRKNKSQVKLKSFLTDLATPCGDQWSLNMQWVKKNSWSKPEHQCDYLKWTHEPHLDVGVEGALTQTLPVWTSFKAQLVHPRGESFSADECWAAAIFVCCPKGQRVWLKLRSSKKSSPSALWQRTLWYKFNKKKKACHLLLSLSMMIW